MNVRVVVEAAEVVETAMSAVSRVILHATALRVEEEAAAVAVSVPRARGVVGTY